MTKRGSRAFFVAGTLISALVFLALTVDSHRKIPALTNAAAIDATVIAGKHVWHRNNCINCHTLLGEGAYYAPDLTQITAQRGAAYLREFLKDPSKFYSEERDGRLMPTLKLSEQEITAVIAFLGWVSKINTQGWPPRPILVRGSAVPGANVGASRRDARLRRSDRGGPHDLQRRPARLLRLSLGRAQRQHRGAHPGGHRRPPRRPGCVPRTTTGRRRTRPATSGSRSSSPTPTC